MPTLAQEVDEAFPEVLHGSSNGLDVADMRELFKSQQWDHTSSFVLAEICEGDTVGDNTIDVIQDVIPRHIDHVQNDTVAPRRAKTAELAATVGSVHGHVQAHMKHTNQVHNVDDGAVPAASASLPDEVAPQTVTEHSQRNAHSTTTFPKALSSSWIAADCDDITGLLVEMHTFLCKSESGTWDSDESARLKLRLENVKEFKGLMEVDGRATIASLLPGGSRFSDALLDEAEKETLRFRLGVVLVRVFSWAAMICTMLAYFGVIPRRYCGFAFYLVCPLSVMILICLREVLWRIFLSFEGMYYMLNVIVGMSSHMAMVNFDVRCCFTIIVGLMSCTVLVLEAMPSRVQALMRKKPICRIFMFIPPVLLAVFVVAHWMDLAPDIVDPELALGKLDTSASNIFAGCIQYVIAYSLHVACKIASGSQGSLLLNNGTYLKYKYDTDFSDDMPLSISDSLSVSNSIRASLAGIKRLSELQE